MNRFLFNLERTMRVAFAFALGLLGLVLVLSGTALFCLWMLGVRP